MKAESSVAPAYMNTGIYEIVNTVNGKRYVGSAVNLRKRWQIHRSKLKHGKHHSFILQAAWAKHGEKAFAFRVLVICERESLLAYEQIALDAISPEYNVLRVAGSSIGRKASIETRRRISEKAKGRRWTDEAKVKLSATLSGRTLTPEHVEKLRGNKHAQGLKHTDQWKAENSARNLGVKRPKDAAYREKIASALRGRKATPEHRANQAAAQLGKKRGPYKKRPPPTPIAQ